MEQNSSRRNEGLFFENWGILWEDERFKKYTEPGKWLSTV
jgi:hypothetical protein